MPIIRRSCGILRHNLLGGRVSGVYTEGKNYFLKMCSVCVHVPPPKKMRKGKKNHLEKYWNICNHEIMFRMEVSFPGFLGDQYIHWNSVFPFSLCMGSPGLRKTAKLWNQGVTSAWFRQLLNIFKTMTLKLKILLISLCIKEHTHLLTQRCVRTHTYDY